MPLPGVRPSRVSQCGKLLAILEDGRWHTTSALLRQVPSIVHSRVAELRTRWGYTIEHRTTGPGAAGSEYRLVGGPLVGGGPVMTAPALSHERPLTEGSDHRASGVAPSVSGWPLGEAGEPRRASVAQAEKSCVPFGAAWPQAAPSPPSPSGRRPPNGTLAQRREQEPDADGAGIPAAPNLLGPRNTHGASVPLGGPQAACCPAGPSPSSASPAGQPPLTGWHEAAA